MKQRRTGRTAREEIKERTHQEGRAWASQGTVKLATLYDVITARSGRVRYFTPQNSITRFYNRGHTGAPRGWGNNYLLSISRVLQGRTEYFEKKSVFQRGFKIFLSVFLPKL